MTAHSTEDLFRADAYLRQCSAKVIGVDGAQIILDRTVFYPTGGGQPGDSGVLLRAEGPTVRILDTRKGAGPTEIRHIAETEDHGLVPGDTVTAEIDWDRRHRHMRIHTCLHLLSAAVPFGVTGGQVSDGKGRLDFDSGEAALDKDAIEARINTLIAEDHPIGTTWITDEEMVARPDLVRTMSVKPPMGLGRVRLLKIGDGVDLQPCGGTHVARTGEIGRVVVEKIESKGKQNRRVTIAFAP